MFLEMLGSMFFGNTFFETAASLVYTVVLPLSGHRVAKNCDWMPVTEFIAKQNKTKHRAIADAEDGLFFDRGHCASDCDSTTAGFSGCSCAPCTHFLRSFVAFLMQGEEDQSLKKNEKRRWSSWTVSRYLRLPKIALEVRRWEHGLPQ